ncbi:alpha/beta hydrolase [uncultured Maribacter sp.]|uniref:alpha/beta fold hydrolase n=1 Tax=uncultured Maribacter sp. TaxID=431308 RepID=UPI002609BE48|nr:alpha/beta hydrolase [uncultured Maribacter sp.]
MRGKIIIIIIFFMTYVGYCQTQYLESFDGTQIAYTDEGKGKVVLLIHGFINSGASWEKTLLKPMLLKEGYRVIVPDLRGTGSSDKPQKDSGYINDAEVRDLVLLINKLNIKKYKAVGYSRGSIILAELLTQDKRIKKAVIGGMGLDFTNKDWSRRILFANAFRGDTNSETKGAVDYAKSINADLQSLHLQQKHQPCTSLEELSKIKAKVLIIAGDLDTDNGSPLDLQKEIPKSAIKIVNGGHNDTVKTLNFATEILDFL